MQHYTCRIRTAVTKGFWLNEVEPEIIGMVRHPVLNDLRALEIDGVGHTAKISNADEKGKAVGDIVPGIARLPNDHGFLGEFFQKRGVEQRNQGRGIFFQVGGCEHGSNIGFDHPA